MVTREADYRTPRTEIHRNNIRRLIEAHIEKAKC